MKICWEYMRTSIVVRLWMSVIRLMNKCTLIFEAHKAVAELDDGDESGGHGEADHTQTRVRLTHVFTPHSSDFY